MVEHTIDDAQDLYNKAVAQYNALSEKEKAEFHRSVEQMRKSAENNHYAGNLVWHGCIDCFRNAGISGLHDGEHYVYLWKHIDGKPFYVGSGKNGRWLNHSDRNRNSAFAEHKKRHDAFVYLVATCMSEQDARDAEFCCIHNLSKRGYDLAQTTGTYGRLNNAQKQRQDARYRKLMQNHVCEKVVDRANELLYPMENKYDLAEILKAYDSYYKRYDDWFCD